MGKLQLRLDVQTGCHEADRAVRRRDRAGLPHAGGGRFNPGPREADGDGKEAHASKMQVHPYTVRSDQLPPYATDVNQLYEVLYKQADVDGLFTDFPDKAVSFLHNK